MRQEYQYYKMNYLKPLQVLFLVTIAMTKAEKYQNSSIVVSDTIFKRLGRTTGLLLLDCWPLGLYEQEEDAILLFQECLQQKVLAALTKTLQCDSIQIFPGIEFTKINKEEGNLSRKRENSVEESEWKNRVLHTIVDVFETHTLKIHLENLLTQDTDVNEARRRHRRGNNMMPWMIFGVVSMGMLLIPMGFKFLTVLGAKALLLAKMALILTSIQGLKKVATSGINYGLYHSPNPVHDRHGLDDIPDEQLDYFFKHMRP